jgi:hypothetical protein
VTEEQARARLVLFADAGSEPILAPEDTETLLDMARRVDKDGIEPAEASWTPTWDINYAIAQAWLLKASRLPNRYLFMSGGKMYSRNQFYEHCMELYRTFLKRSPLKAIRLAATPSDLDMVPSNWNGAHGDYPLRT